MTTPPPPSMPDKAVPESFSSQLVNPTVRDSDSNRTVEDMLGADAGFAELMVFLSSHVELSVAENQRIVDWIAEIGQDARENDRSAVEIMRRLSITKLFATVLTSRSEAETTKAAAMLLQNTPRHGS